MQSIYEINLQQNMIDLYVEMRVTYYKWIQCKYYMTYSYTKAHINIYSYKYSNVTLDWVVGSDDLSSHHLLQSSSYTSPPININKKRIKNDCKLKSIVSKYVFQYKYSDRI